MSDLVTWLRAQLDSDEADALAACQGDGYREWDNPSTGVVQVAGGDLEGLVLAPRNAAHHIAVHDPARVLRQVAAMRKIVDMCQSGIDPQTPATPGVRASYRAILSDLATIYADRDGYRPEWAPEGGR